MDPYSRGSWLDTTMVSAPRAKTSMASSGFLANRMGCPQDVTSNTCHASMGRLGSQVPAEASKRTKELENVRERRLFAEKELAVDILDEAASVKF